MGFTLAMVLQLWTCQGKGDAAPASFSRPRCHREAFDEHAKVKNANDKLESDKSQSFRSFLAACVYLEEVLEVIELPQEIRERLGHRSTGLVAVTSETVASLKATFSQAA